MKLVTFGDSWIYGDEILPDTIEYRNGVIIGGLIYKDFKFSKYINYANNGASNERIALQIMEYKNSDNYSEDDFLVVGLTSPLRNLLYLNHGHAPLTLPSWDEMHIKTRKDSPSDSVYKDWFKKTGFYLTNNRNDLVRYANNLFTIKSLLASNKKYLVWQSIDDIHKIYDDVEMKGWNEVRLHWDDGNEFKEKDSKIFFDKEYIKKELSSNLEDTQVWINFNEPSWQTVLNKDVLLHGGVSEFMVLHHPNEKGHLFWYENFIKKYIKNIL